MVLDRMVDYDELVKIVIGTYQIKHEQEGRSLNSALIISNSYRGSKMKRCFGCCSERHVIANCPNNRLGRNRSNSTSNEFHNQH